MATKIFKKPILPMTGATSSAAGESGLVPTPAAGDENKFLKGDGLWGTPLNTTYSEISRGSSAGLAPGLPAGDGTTKYLREDGSWAVPPDNNTTYSFSNNAVTLAWNTTHTIATVGGTDITLKMPPNPDTNTTYGTVSKTAAGLCPKLPNETTTTKYLRQDGSWVVPPDNNTTYSFSNKAVTLAWNTTHTIATVGGTNITLKMPANPNTNTTYAFTDKNVTLAWGTKSTIATVGGVDIHVTMPANPNTNTWRGCQNNLTSTYTDQSLSAAMGKKLNEEKVFYSRAADQIITATSGVCGFKTASYQFKFQSDGNFVIYRVSDNAAVWALKWYYNY